MNRFAEKYAKLENEKKQKQDALVYGTALPSVEQTQSGAEDEKKVAKKPSQNKKKLGEPLCRVGSPSYRPYMSSGKDDRKKIITVLSHENSDMLAAVANARTLSAACVMNDILDEYRTLLQEDGKPLAETDRSYKPMAPAEKRSRANRVFSILNYNMLLDLAQKRGGLSFVQITNDVLDEYRSLF